MKATRALFAWAEENGVCWDRRVVPAGDAFACRIESYLTDYRLKPRKKQWEINFAIKLAEDELTKAQKGGEG